MKLYGTVSSSNPFDRTHFENQAAKKILGVQTNIMSKLAYIPTYILINIFFFYLPFLTRCFLVKDKQLMSVNFGFFALSQKNRNGK